MEMSENSPEFSVCKACRVNPADSSEHVFHSALGGTLKVPGVLCTHCNNVLGCTIDAALVEQFSFHRSALEIVGDRGQTPEFSVQHPEHGRLDIEQGLHPKLGARKPEVQRLEDDTVMVKAVSERIAKQVIASEVRKNPEVNVLSVAREVAPAPTAEFRVRFGGEAFHRSCLKVMLVYIEHLGLIPSDALRDAWDYVRHGHSPSSIRISSVPHFSPWQLPSTMSGFSHQLLFESSEDGTLIRAALSLFGGPLIMTEFATPSTARRLVGLAQDPSSGHTYNAADWPSPLPIIDSTRSRDANAALAKHLGQVLEANAQFRDDRALTEMVNLASQPFDNLREGDVITEEIVREFVKRAAALMVGRQFGETVILDDPGLLQKFREAQGKKKKQ